MCKNIIDATIKETFPSQPKQPKYKDACGCYFNLKEGSDNNDVKSSHPIITVSRTWGALYCTSCILCQMLWCCCQHVSFLFCLWSIIVLDNGKWQLLCYSVIFRLHVVRFSSFSRLESDMGIIFFPRLTLFIMFWLDLAHNIIK